MTGEFTRIEQFLQSFREAGGRIDGGVVALGPGDDCALLKPVALPTAITTDAIVEDVHFRRAWATPEQIGHKALAVNLSDLAAMGAQPTTFTCALGVPWGFPDADLRRIARGMGTLAARFGAVLCGGNFTRARELSITITALGTIESDPLRRHSACPRDVVLLVGDVGVAAAELKVLDRGGKLPEGRSALLLPEPLVEAGREAAKLARCAIDVSDGLVQDLSHVADASGVLITIDATRLLASDRFRALTPGVEELEKKRLQLAGGEDYALVVIAGERAARELEWSIGAVEIGSVAEGHGVSVIGAPAGLRLEGHDHFA